MCGGEGTHVGIGAPWVWWKNGVDVARGAAHVGRGLGCSRALWMT